MLPNTRPIAKASAGCSVRPTTPRMSYSRRLVGSKSCLNAILGRSGVFLEERFHVRFQVRPLQGERDLGLEEADLVAAVEALPLIPQAVERGVPDHPGH